MGQGEASKNPCDNFKDIDVTTSTPPCPQNVNQAFFDNNLEVDPGCVEDSKAPFNCYTNPGAAKCFRVLQRLCLHLYKLTIYHSLLIDS
jgi:hypothetical protein